MTEKHTETPWVTGRSVNFHDLDIFTCAYDTAHPEMVAHANTSANAELIVRAVNAHQAMVEALRIVADPGHVWDNANGRFKIDLSRDEWVAIRAALARAEKGAENE